MTDPNMPGVHTELGPIREDTKKVAYEVVAAARAAGYPLYFVWGIGGTGDHKYGKAIDFMVYDDGTVQHPGPERPAVGDWVADYVWKNRERLGVRYEIWNRRIRSTTGTPPNVWLAYHGTTDPHTNHVHVSRLADPPKYVIPPQPKPEPVSKPIDGWPGQGWAHVSVAGDKFPWANGRVKASTNSRIRHRRKDGFNIQYKRLVKNHEGLWLVTRWGTYYLVGHDLVKGKKK